MRFLTDNEIKFIKATGVTPTVIQLDEWKRTGCVDFPDAWNVAAITFGVADPKEFFHMLTSDKDSDSISIDNNAIYLFYTFFTEEELKNMTSEEALKWLQDWKYYFGYRKCSEDEAAEFRDAALDMHLRPDRYYFKEIDGDVWVLEYDSWYIDHPEGD